jgi:hypothetical protein
VIEKPKTYDPNSWRREKPAGNFVSHLHFSENKLTDKHITTAFDELRNERTARLAGLLGHFAYWCTFGHINQMPLDDYHLKQLFISIAQTVS